MGNSSEDIKSEVFIEDYRFTYDREPSDEQLAIIMKEVAIEAKRKATEANSIFMSKLSEQIRIIKQSQLSKSDN